MFLKYPLKDRVLDKVWDFQMENGVPKIVESSGEYFPEIKLRDEFLEDTYWLVYVKNGFIGIETSVIQEHDTIIFFEQASSTKYSLGANNGFLKTRRISERTDIVKYSMLDRNLSVVWDIIISNGFPIIVPSTEEDQGEINVLDQRLSETYWTIFIRNGVFGIEPSVIELDTIVLFMEETTERLYRLGVQNGVLKCPQIVILSTDEFNVSLVLSNIRTDLRKSRVPVFLDKPDTCISPERRLVRMDLKNSELPVSYERKEYER